jgi:hypothetical protein
MRESRASSLTKLTLWVAVLSAVAYTVIQLASASPTGQVPPSTASVARPAHIAAPEPDPSVPAADEALQHAKVMRSGSEPIETF